MSRETPRLPGALIAALAAVAGALAGGVHTDRIDAAAGRGPVASTARAPAILIRANQVGYAPADHKPVVVMARHRLGGRTIAVLRGRRVALRRALGRPHRRWNKTYPVLYVVDLGRLRRPGVYTVAVGGARSVRLKIADPAALYGPLVAHATRFFAAQRDGPVVDPAVIHRRPAHLNDLTATVYAPPRYRGHTLVEPLVGIAGPTDVSGGWSDAGDYLKFAETASFTDVMLEFSALRYPGTPALASIVSEARFGTDWLLKLWHPDTGTLDYQVGIGDGRGGARLGDHDLWRLPQRDDGLRGGRRSPTYYIKHRPVFRTGGPGAQLSPNLAGRLAAAFGLCSQLFRDSDPAYAARCLFAGQTVYDHARTDRVGGLVTTTPHDYYPETVWRDDLSLGATELYSATAGTADKGGLPHADPGYYLAQAGHWASVNMTSGQAGQDSLNLYDVSALTDFELFGALADSERRSPHSTGNVEVIPQDLTRDLRDQLRAARRFSRRDAFGLADPNGIADSVPHALGYELEARFYDDLTGSRAFEALATRERDWVLGDNAWGSSFIVGAGTRFPRCVQHQVANLSGSLSGHGTLLLGATVDGPNDALDFRDLGLPDGYRACPRNRRDPFSVFSTRRARYLDNAIAASSSEPTDDYTALALAAFAQQSANGAHS